MDNEQNPNESALQIAVRLVLSESTTDLTKICWTQMLRKIPEAVGPPRPFDPLPENFSPENWSL